MSWVYDGRGEKFQAEAAVDTKPEESLGRGHAIGCILCEVNDTGTQRLGPTEAGLSLSG